MANEIQLISDVAVLKRDIMSAHERINKNERIIEGIHKLAANVELLALQVKTLTENLESSVDRLENGLKRQGERIGVLEKEPAAKWKTLTTQVTALIVAALIGGFFARFIN